MRSKWFNTLVTIAMVLGMLPLVASQAPAAAAPADEVSPVAPASIDRDPSAPRNLEEVPAEIQKLFAEGMSVEDFVAMTGHVPRALEGLVDGDALMIIELEDQPAAVRYVERRDAGQLMTQETLDTAIQRLEAVQERLEPRLMALGAEIISNYTVVYNGFQALVPLDRLNAIRALPGVKAVHRAPIHEPALGASVPLIGADQVWEDLGFDGEGITIAIIDTGIDYTHAAFGGPGTKMAYELNDPEIIEPGTFPTEKVVGGWDFAGTLYHAGCPPADEAAGICTRIPNPDPDPLDEHSHGTHVASIAAGFATGDVMTGTAPAADLMALKVFGQSGSTALTLDALEWATLHYIYHGTPQVINMSLGAIFGTGDIADPSVAGSQLAAEVGIVVVASAGNAGNNSYITGSPATADRAISVAASTTGFATGPTINIQDTEYITQTNIIYTPSSFDAGGEFDEEVIAPLGYVGDLDGAPNNLLCSEDDWTGVAPDALEGQVALIQRGACPFSEKVNNAAALGAVAAIIFNNAPGPFGMIGDPVVIPAGSIQMQDGENLIPADGETAIISAEDDVSTVPDPYTPADYIATFSSRGPRGVDSFLKPEITGPGVGTFAADMGTGAEGTSKSGTSMSAPHVAGVAALMAQANPDWTPEQIKAGMMNTAVDLADETTIPRSGAGRVDAYGAVGSEVVAIGDEDLVSLNFGVDFSRNDTVERVKEVTLSNWGESPQVFTAAAAFQTGSRTAGAMISVDPLTVTVPAGGSAVVDVTLSLHMTEIPVEFRIAEEYYGFVTFTPQLMPIEVSDMALRVPFYVQPRPYSQLDIEADTAIADPAEDIGVITITHQGPITSSLWAYPALLWNDAPDPAMTGPADVRLFGMDYGWFQPGEGDIIEVGINTWDYWHVPQPFFAEFDLYIDANQDGEWDFVNFNYNFGWLTGTGHNNVWVVIQVDLATGMLDLGSPWVIYTDYNASYMEWWLPAPRQGLGPTNSAFNYMLLGFDDDGVSANPPGRFDYARSPFAWSISGNPGPAEPTAVVQVGISDLVGYLYSEPEGFMLVDYHGDPRNQNGGQAYFVPFEIDSAFVQVAHLAPFAEDASVTIFVDGMPILAGVDYGFSTGYLPLPPDEYLVEIVPMGTETVAISATIEIEALGFYTAIAIGDGVNQELALMLLEDDLTPPAPGTFHLRLGHLAPFAPGDATADVRLADGTPVLEDVDFGDVSGYIPLPAGEYDIIITTPGGETTLIDPLPVALEEGQILSAFATGDGVNQDLSVFALPAGEEGFFLPLRVEWFIYMPIIFNNFAP